jgi:hypothetical protein
MNIKLDTIMKKLHINEADLIKAEEESDKKLEAEKKAIQNNTGRVSTSPRTSAQKNKHRR